MEHCDVDEENPYWRLNSLYDTGLHLVKFLVEKDFQNAIESGYEKDDLVGYGVFGLLEACRKYNGATKFRTFACYKIRQRILDYLRKDCQRPWKYLDEFYNEGSQGNEFCLKEIYLKRGERKLLALKIKEDGKWSKN